ncbi:MAG: NAD(P)-dependent oxidoreductase [Colwellia sp.]
MGEVTKVALTGGTGMVGRHLKALLDSKGIEYVDINRSRWDLVSWKTADEIDTLLGDIDALLHVGAAVPSPLHSLTTQALFDANVRVCVAMAEWAVSKRVPIVYLSGATVYKNPHSRNICEDDEKTTNNFGGFYGFTKYLAEQVFNHYAHNGLQVIILRPTSIYGAGMGAGKLVTDFLERAKNNEIIEVQPPYDNAVNFIHAADVARAILQSLKSQAWGTYNVSSSENSTIEELARTCVAQAGAGDIELIKKGELGDQVPFLRFDLNCKRAFDAFGFTPRIPLDAGIKLLSAEQYL